MARDPNHVGRSVWTAKYKWRKYNATAIILVEHPDNEKKNTAHDHFRRVTWLLTKILRGKVELVPTFKDDAV